MTRIAIIEDDTIISQMYRMKFEMTGFDVEVSDTAKDGLAMIKKFKPDLLLLDFFLPQANGVDVLRAIRADKRFATLPVILLTNADRSEISENLDDFHIADFIVKAQLTPKQVVQKVQQALQ